MTVEYAWSRALSRVERRGVRIDIAFLLVVASTVGMYLVDRNLGATAAGTQLIVGMVLT